MPADDLGNPEEMPESDWEAAFEGIEALLDAAGVPLPVKTAKDILAVLRRHSTTQGKLEIEYAKLKPVHAKSALKRLFEDVIGASIAPLATASSEQDSVLERIEGRINEGLDQIVELLYRLLSSRAAAAPQVQEIIDYSAENLRHKRFLGRNDIFREFHQWLREHESGWLILTGPPGIGKSAILNRWRELRDETTDLTAFHFIRRAYKNWAEPCAIQANLSAQIERLFPEQRDHTADPAYRLEQILGRVSPLLTHSGKQLVLLVDGLDEAMSFGDDDNPIPKILPIELPTGVFVCASSRPRYPHLNWFARRGGPVRTIELDRCADSNTQTVQAFWQTLRNQLTPPLTDEAVEALVEQAEGNMLHAVKIYDMWSHPGSERRIDSIPRGFEGMLSELWERVGKFRGEQRTPIYNGLALLCAAREALPLSLIEELLGWQPGSAKCDFFPFAREMLLEEHQTNTLAYRPFHEGFREFVEREIPTVVREQHELLIKFSSWPLSGNSFQQYYTLRHRVAHLLASARTDDAATCCQNVEYLTEKCRRLGVVEVEREVRLVAHVHHSEANRQLLQALAQTIAACAHWAKNFPAAMPSLLHDRLLTHVPAMLNSLTWPDKCTSKLLWLRHPLQTRGSARVFYSPHYIPSVAVLSDGRIVTAILDTVEVWDDETGKPMIRLKGHEDDVSVVAVLPDDRIVSGSKDQTLRIWDVATGGSLAVLSDHEAAVTAVALSPGGYIVSGSDDGVVCIWDLESCQLINSFRVSYNSIWQMVSVAEDLIAVIVSTHRNTEEEHGAKGVSHHDPEERNIHLWRVPSGEIEAVLVGHDDAVAAVSAMPCGRIVSSDFMGELHSWDGHSHKHLDDVFQTDAGVPFVLTPLGPGTFVAGLDDGKLQIRESGSCDLVSTLSGHQKAISAVVTTADNRIISASEDLSVRVWADSHVKDSTAVHPHRHAVLSVVGLPGGRVVSSDLFRVRVWDGDSGDICVEHEKMGDNLAVLPNGMLVSLFFGTIDVWDPETGEIFATYESTATATGALCAVPGNRVLFSWGNGLVLWDVVSEEIVHVPGAVDSNILSVGILSNGWYVAGYADGTLCIWDPGSLNSTGRARQLSALGRRRPRGRGARPRCFRARYQASTQIAALPNGYIVTTYADGIARIWDPSSGREIASLNSHQDAAIAVSALGHDRIVTGSHDKTVRIWSADDGRQLGVVYGESSFQAVVSIKPHYIAAGDTLGNVWFVDVF